MIPPSGGTSVLRIDEINSIVSLKWSSVPILNESHAEIVGDNNQMAMTIDTTFLYALNHITNCRYYY